MSNKWLYSFLIISSVILVESIVKIDLEIDSQDLFPYPANKSFGIYIVNKIPGGTISDSMTDTMVVLIREYDGTKKELERAIFDYGFKDMIDQPYRGEYMTIPVWAKKSDGKAINISILFSRPANNQSLEVYQLAVQNHAERRQMLADLTNSATLLLRDRVSLLVSPRIEMSILSPDGRKNELMVAEKATATCRAYDGWPAKEPIFVGLGELDVTNTAYDSERNERTAQFRVSLYDHEKRLLCRAGDTETSGIVLVLHHPTQVNMDPDPGPLLANGSTILCLKADGHPAPSLRWTVVVGPANASRFYTITDSDTKFTLAKDAPLRSRWTINCTATNIIPGSVVHYNRTVSFTVGRSQEGLFDKLNLTAQIIIGVVVVGAIVLFCTLILVIICIVRRCCVGHAHSNTSRKNGVQSKTVSTDKVMDAEQVTLLPMGAPPNYIDLSNSGANLPPPPPEYELMINEEPIAVVSHDKENANEDSLRYTEVTYAELNTSNLPMKNEVTYAELNTSNLPMKNCPSPQISSCNDDQVIYSQIVGTVSNPYNAQRSYTEPNDV